MGSVKDADADNSLQVMHDEAVSHYEDILTQLTKGREWLFETFKIRPRYAWCTLMPGRFTHSRLIDPFGHAATTPVIYHQAGYKGVVINRIHDALKTDYRYHHGVDQR
jgi:hypothetical protein